MMHFCEHCIGTEPVSKMSLIQNVFSPVMRLNLMDNSRVLVLVAFRYIDPLLGC